MTLLHKLLSRVHKRDLDPSRAARVWHEYDVVRGYEEYSRYCQSVCTRKPITLPQMRLMERGYADLAILPTAACIEIVEHLKSHYPPVPVKQDSRDLVGFLLTDRQYLKGLLESMLTDAVDAQCLAFFKSEYLVHTATFTLTPAAKRQRSVSFRWHCDKGPTRHLKLIVYLNASAQHGGSTAFIDLVDTKAVANRGYLFGLSRTRTVDIERLQEIAGRSLASHQQEFKAGQGVLFQPARVLHRGVSPHSGDRIAATLCLLPSPVPWSEAFARNVLVDLTTNDKWHRHASELQSWIDISAD